jgi:hypothetical protein
MTTYAEPATTTSSDAGSNSEHGSGGSQTPTNRDTLGGYAPLFLTAAGSALGVLIVAVAFALGRANHPYSGPLYWLGESFVFLVPAYFVLRRGVIGLNEGVGLAVIVGLATFAIKVCYSPIQFTFSDEFQHLPTATHIIASHHLFGPNPALAVSPNYPGMEIVATSLATLSHLSIYASATILLGVVHLVATIGLFFIATELLRNPKLAALAVLVYALGPDYQFFTTYFAYESLGLPLVIAGLLALIQMEKSTELRVSVSWMLAALAIGAATTVTHHVSSYAFVGLAGAIVIPGALRAAKRSLRLVALSTLALLAGFVLIWDLVVADGTVSYLHNAFSQLLFTKSSLPNISSSVVSIAGGPIFIIRSVSTLPPVFDRVMEYVWALGLSILVLAGVLTVWRKKRDCEPILWGLAVASTLVFAAFFLEVATPGGGELATRLMTFALIPGSILCAYALQTLVERRELDAGESRHAHATARNWPGAFPIISIAFLGVVFVVGAIATGWPPFYSRIPGPYLVGGRDRSIDSYGLNAAQWAHQDLKPNNVVASDISNNELMQSLGRQIGVNGRVTTFLIIGKSIPQTLASEVRAKRIRLVVVDRRIGNTVPVAGNPVFLFDPFADHYYRPIPSESLSKFNSLPSVSRIYDNGPISVYDLGGSTYGG